MAATPTPSASLDAVVRERQRQIEQERWSAEHDDEHTDCSLAVAAACYALHGTPAMADPYDNLPRFNLWPWDARWWKPRDRRQNLVRAGALILAEIDRLDRENEQHMKANDWS